MAQLYTQNQVLGHLPTKTQVHPDQAMVQEFSKEAAQQHAQTQHLYTRFTLGALGNSAQKTFNQFSDDPENLAKALDDQTQKVLADLPDQKVKNAVALGALMQRQALVKRASQNQENTLYRQERMAQGRQIQDNLSLMQTAYSNMLTPGQHTDDYGLYLQTLSENNILKERQVAGRNLFTPSQQEHVLKATDEAKLVALKSVFNALPAGKKEDFLEKLSRDEAKVYVDEKQNIPLQDTLSVDHYQAFKNYALKVQKTKKEVKENTALADEEEAFDKAVRQTMTQEAFQSEWTQMQQGYEKGRRVKRVPSSADVLAYRQQATQAYQAGNLEEKIYQKLLKETAGALLDSKNTPKGDFSWQSNLDILLKGTPMEKTESPEQQAFKKDFLFKTLQEEGLDPKAPFAVKNYPQLEKIQGLTNAYFNWRYRGK